MLEISIGWSDYIFMHSPWFDPYLVGSMHCIFNISVWL